ncbi:hypothetical protein ACET3X_002346 [Alternaria dauci]|uniref:Uncharacterized protein n=1 Tax=Alternaria dauci TaxID=48095 RepID=A0ABR3UPR7_9PLEO
MEVTHDKARNSAHTKAPSTTVVTVAMTPQAEPSIMPAGRQILQDGRRATSQLTKAKISYHTRLLRATSRMVPLGVFFMYLGCAIITLCTGLLCIGIFMQPRLNRAVDEFHVQSTTLHKEQILYSRLDKLLSEQLSRGFMETHEDCLIRGLEKANDELFGLGFQYSDMRARIMEWTMDNCGRLQYTPQVVTQDPTPQQAVLTYWANMRYRSSRILEEALEAARLKARSIWNRFLGSIYVPNIHALAEHISTSSDTGDTPSSIQSRPEVPFGFALRCEPSQPCRLVYPPLSSVRPDKVSTTPKAIAKLERRLRELSAFDANLQKGVLVTQYLAKVLIIMGWILFGIRIASLVGAASYMAATKKIARKKAPTWLTRLPGPMTTDDNYIVKILGFCLALEWFDYLLVKYSEHLVRNGSMVLLGLFSLLLSSSMLLRFFIAPKPRFPDIYQFCGLVKELYLIMQGYELPAGEDIDSELSSVGVIHVEAPGPRTIECSPTGAETNSGSSDHHQRNRSVNPHRRSVSLLASLAENLETQEKVLREELKEVERLQVMENDAQFGYDTDVFTDTDSEPGTEDNGFVDLAGGVTPQLTDAESGWSVVDA